VDVDEDEDGDEECTARMKLTCGEGDHHRDQPLLQMDSDKSRQKNCKTFSNWDLRGARLTRRGDADMRRTHGVP